jgi:short-subunit dehydrogenase
LPEVVLEKHIKDDLSTRSINTEPRFRLDHEKHKIIAVAMAFPYKHVLIIGATSGIGRGMADHFIAQGLRVTAVGRRQERLDEFIANHGENKATGIACDIEKLDEIPAFIARYISSIIPQARPIQLISLSAFETHPTIDSIMLNAGVQSPANFTKPDTVNLTAFHRETTINFTAQVALVHASLPYLFNRASPTSLIFTGTQVSVVPVFGMPAYSSSKAALDAFIMCLREQLRDTRVSVQHISPGPVQTELHEATLGKDAGSNFGMPLSEFVDEAWAGLAEGRNDIFPGTVGGSTKEQFLELVRLRDEATARMSGLLRRHLG